MPYRGLLYFVSQSASSDYRSDPYATERRCLPNRTHGIRYASAPKRTWAFRLESFGSAEPSVRSTAGLSRLALTSAARSSSTLKHVNSLKILMPSSLSQLSVL